MCSDVILFIHWIFKSSSIEEDLYNICIANLISDGEHSKCASYFVNVAQAIVAKEKDEVFYNDFIAHIYVLYLYKHIYIFIYYISGFYV